MSRIKRRTKKVMIRIVVVILCVALAISGMILYGKYQISKIPGLTFTAALINKATTQEKINLDDTIDNYLSLPYGKKHPTIKELLTHTSGYKGYYFENPMISNFFKGRNDFMASQKKWYFTKQVV